MVDSDGSSLTYLKGSTCKSSEDNHALLSVRFAFGRSVVSSKLGFEGLLHAIVVRDDSCEPCQ